MKQIILIGLILSLVGSSNAQGIKFEQGLSWAQIKVKAKAENKFIFMDCYATWCGPCKYMSKNVFPQKEVGDYFNSHFISVAVQMDRTANDAAAIRQWYADAKAISAAYTVEAFPTYLFFSPDGNVSDRLVGAYEADEFIAKGKDALNPEKQYYTIMNGVPKHLGDAIFLRHALETAEAYDDGKNTGKIANLYLKLVKGPGDAAVDKLLMSSMTKGSGPVFQFLLRNAVQIDSALHSKEEIEMELGGLIARDQIDPLFTTKDTLLNFSLLSSHFATLYPTLEPQLQMFIEGHFWGSVDHKLGNELIKMGDQLPDWQLIEQRYSAMYPGFYTDRIIAGKKPQYYKKKAMWPEAVASSIAFLESYGYHLSGRDINDCAWDILFLHATDKESLGLALKWAKHMNDDAPGRTEFMDTYANLLYKTGQKNEAMTWEQRAFDISEKNKNEGDMKAFRETLDKMKVGKPTWTDNQVQ